MKTYEEYLVFYEKDRVKRFSLLKYAKRFYNLMKLHGFEVKIFGKNVKETKLNELEVN